MSSHIQTLLKSIIELNDSDHHNKKYIKQVKLELQKICKSRGGLEASAYRRIIWPFLLGCKMDDMSIARASKDLSIAEHRIETTFQLSDKFNKADILGTANPPSQRHHHLNKRKQSLVDMVKSQLQLLISYIPIFNKKIEHEFFIDNQRDQMEKDVSRSFHTSTNQAEMRSGLFRIMEVIINMQSQSKNHKGNKYYYQGLHDICSVPLQIGTEQFALIMMNRLVNSYFYEPCNHSQLTCILPLMSLIFRLIEKLDANVYQILLESGNETCHFSVSWILTWFAHDIKNVHQLARLFDVFLVTSPLMVCYISAVYIVVVKKAELIKLEEIQFPTVFKCLRSFTPIQDDILENIIEKSIQLFEEHPPTDVGKNLGIQKSYFREPFTESFHRYKQKKPAPLFTTYSIISFVVLFIALYKGRNVLSSTVDMGLKALSGVYASIRDYVIYPFNLSIVK